MYSSPLHWLFSSVYAFVIWEGKTDGFSSYVMFSAFLTFTEIIGYLEKKKKNLYFVESSLFVLHFLRKGNIGFITFNFNLGRERLSLEMCGKFRKKKKISDTLVPLVSMQES